MEDAQVALRALLATLRQARCTEAPTVARWTGVEVRALRLAMHRSVRDFAGHLGVSDRMVSKWEAGAGAIRPRAVNQAALTTAYALAGKRDPGVAHRFARHLHAAAALGRGRLGGAVETGERQFELHVSLAVASLADALDVAAELSCALVGHPDYEPAGVTVSAMARSDHRFAVALPWLPS